jgi:alpha-tubulin suppressor-like RCC1 family protein
VEDVLAGLLRNACPTSSEYASTRRSIRRREIELAIQHRSRVVNGRAVAAAIVAIASALTMAIASSAQAASTVAYAWGFNKDGELGNGTIESSDVPVEVSGLRAATAIAGGSHHSLALLENGTVLAWGENVHGQLGNGTEDNSDVPIAVSGLSDVTAISAGENHSLALLQNGTVMAWGKNSSGELGNGTTTNSDLPVAVSDLSEVAAISAGGSFSLALLKNGTVMAWGENVHGQLGDGTEENRDVPIAVRGLGGVTAISAGFRHSLALLSDGTVMAWGENALGQLGNDSEISSDVPVAVSRLSGVGAISAGHSHSLALLAKGGVIAWGDNEQGQLGNGTHTGPEQCGVPPLFACSKIPVAVSGLGEVTAISVAGNYSLALLSSRTVMAWGQDTSGQLGNGINGPEACGTVSCSTSPVAVCAQGPQVPCPTGPELNNVKRIAAGEAHGLAIVEPPPALPELGRCVKVPSGGAYRGTSPRCVALSSTHKGHFEWLPGPGPNSKFRDDLSQPMLETVDKHKVDCVAALLEGEYTGPKTETISHLTLDACLDVTPNTRCQSNPLKEGVIESSVPLEGDLGFILGGEKPSVGWDLEPKPPATSLVSFVCGSGVSTAAVALEGSVIGRLTPINQMVLTFELLYKQSGGKQIPELFEGGARDVLILATTPFTGATTSEQAGLKSKDVRTGEGLLEIKAKV